MFSGMFIDLSNTTLQQEYAKLFDHVQRGFAHTGKHARLPIEVLVVQQARKHMLLLLPRALHYFKSLCFPVIPHVPFASY